MSDRLATISNEFERALNAGELKFGPLDLGQVPASTATYVDAFVCQAGFDVELCGLSIDGCYLFKLNDPVVGFLFHDSVSEFHMWADGGFANSLNPQAAFWYVMCKKIKLGTFGESVGNKSGGS